MGRPKGSKNKLKENTVVIEQVERPSTVALSVSKPHTIEKFADYVLERMDGTELDYYKKMSRSKERPIKYLLAKTLMDFFKIHDKAFDINTLLETTTK